MNFKLKIRILEVYPSQIAFAHDLGVDSACVSKWVRGWTEPRGELKEIVCKKLERNPDELFPAS